MVINKMIFATQSEIIVGNIVCYENEYIHYSIGNLIKLGKTVIISILSF